jgi:hypothetical protein
VPRHHGTRKYSEGRLLSVSAISVGSVVGAVVGAVSGSTEAAVWTAVIVSGVVWAVLLSSFKLGPDSTRGREAALRAELHAQVDAVADQHEAESAASEARRRRAMARPPKRLFTPDDE